MIKAITLSKNTVIKVIFTILTVLLTLFIWLHSLTPAEQSSEESDFVLEFVNSILNNININANISSFIVRKAAHFLEFTALGLFVTATATRYEPNIKKCIFHILFILLAVPVTDEALQYLAPERSPQISDVLLNFSGCITGLLLTVILLWIIKTLKNKKGLKGM
ncbi:MAG: VanZ family protein [Acutalibacteraceae bacterium]|nr:VanZ family protein [Acutalibacteraceae bacterium]